ncbi:MlaC/ttg2D family ABC transporter substrate-binding protein [Thermaurantiacus sp.]
MFRLVAAAALVAATGSAVPAIAQAASAEAQAEAATFIDGLAREAFAVLRDPSVSRAEARRRFGRLLTENFDIERGGARLIRKHRATLTPEQLAAYREALPGFLVGTYADRLYDFRTWNVAIVRQVPRGPRGDVDVYLRASDPKGGKPIETIWSTSKATGRWLVTNVTVNGVNLALTQEADFDAYIRRNGFDALVDFLRKKA